MYRYRRNKDLDREREAYEILAEDLLAEIESRRRWEDATRHRRAGLWGQIRDRGDYNRAASRLRADLARELRAIRAIEGRMGRSRDPVVRELLANLLEEAHERGITMDELARYYNGGGLQGRLASLLPGGGAGGLSWALPLLLLLLALPPVRQGLKPLTKKVVKGAMDISEKIEELFTTAKEEMEDIVAEVNFEKIKNSLSVPEDPPPTS